MSMGSWGLRESRRQRRRQVRRRVAMLAGPGGDPATAARRLAPAQLDEVRSFYRSQTEAALGEPIGDRRLVDKLPLNLVDLGLINVVFPGAPIIVALRDPRDACLSCFFQDFGLNAAMIHFTTLPATAAFYAMVMDLWLHVREHVTLPWIEVRYEDVVQDPVGSVRNIYESLDLGDFAAVREDLAAYARAQAGYQRNIYEFSEDYLSRIEPYLKDAAEHWSYEPPVKQAAESQVG